MADTIGFLEALGRGTVSYDDGDIFEAAVSRLDVDDAQKAALVAGDFAALSTALGGRPAMMMQVWAPRRGPQEQEQSDEVPDEDAPAEDAPPEK